MPDVLVRGLEPSVIERLKARANRENRSLQAEVKSILTEASTRTSTLSRREVARRIRESIARSGRQQTDSALLLREDRDR